MRDNTWTDILHAAKTKQAANVVLDLRVVGWSVLIRRLTSSVCECRDICYIYL